MYESDEEQVEALRKWWDENGKSVIVGLVIGVTAVVSWIAWKDYRVEHSREASSLYGQIIAKVDRDQPYAEKINKMIQDDYADTPYAALAALHLAKAKVGDASYDEAVKYLQRTLDTAGSDEVRHVARLRLARVLKEQGEIDKALELIESVAPEKFAGLYSELLGDLYMAKNMKDKAAFAYEQAVVAGAVKEDWVQMKLDSLGSK